MFDIGWWEILILAGLAIIVVGPKDLPGMMRVVGGYVARIQGMAGEFRRNLDEMARESELEEFRQEVRSLREENPFSQLKKELEDEVVSSVDTASDILHKPGLPESPDPSPGPATDHRAEGSNNTRGDEGPRE